MNCKDLMVGDWVSLSNPADYGRQVRVQAILDKSIVCVNRRMMVTMGYVQPIPLTEEILVKNGWDFRDRQYAIECEEDERGIVELSRDKDGYYWSINRDEYLIIRIHYVHELQHIIQLCGIEKEIEL